MAGVSFNFNSMLTGLGKFASGVQSQLKKLQSATSGAVSLSTMFTLQFNMQVMSQYMEAVSNTLTAVNTEMINMAKGAKGQ
ncbi:MAG: hypothetical protein KR126chlam2_00669 [Chlamydiae bacterium]|nr:hypothetical protein [Chlamydiota bacterium]